VNLGFRVLRGSGSLVDNPVDYLASSPTAPVSSMITGENGSLELTVRRETTKSSTLVVFVQPILSHGLYQRNLPQNLGSINFHTGTAIGLRLGYGKVAGVLRDC
jgi:hypothetical protein